MSKQFLLEVGLEEVPAHLVTPTSKQFAKKAADYLNEHRVSFDNIEVFSTPRRFAIRVNGLADKQENIEEKAKGPAKKIAQDADGNWTKAAIGFAKGQGATTDDLYVETIKDVEYVFVDKFIEGQPVETILPGLTDVAAHLTFPISMTWGEGNYRFIRPVHWLVALLEDNIIPMSLFGINSSNTSRGHRFLGKVATINHSSDYETALEEQFVIVNPVIRQDKISKQINDIEEANQWTIPQDADLLEEVVNLVEYPTVFVGNFEKNYLSLPSEVLITSMKEHQRYFEVLDSEGNLLNHFVSVRNGNSDYLDNVRKGNEKVLQARLEDAEFFYEEDLKSSIADYVEKLKSVTFHEKIGSMYEKMQRVSVISRLIGTSVGLSDTEMKDLERAAQIYKFDLVTLMVDEFPELQGLIGEKYATIKGESKGVAQAIREHYLPKSSDGELPESNVGAVLAIADKSDTLLSFFAVGLMPKGSNDPYALRRQAYGIIRIIESKGWDFPIVRLQQQMKELINEDIERFGLSIDSDEEVLTEFIKGRMKQWFSGKKIRHDIIEAVLESRQENLHTMFETADILESHAAESDFRPTIESLTRVINLSNKVEDNEIGAVNPDLFENESEKKLYDAIASVSKKVGELTLNELYEELRQLNPLIEAYFEDTMVMVDNDEVRTNRLNQLRTIANIALSFASLDRLIVK
ncbi:glycine--tRNA ligase subunit beta [Vagococcus martis]|uniref:Glycine--tRNA ligase beta subunit n=1 Tax=Vagococcus martis TaxID=1768210 RepID=A0A1V4DE81_9ENTE|nr:glycine--tRNA ligase subunit beta [Vagococcus martis]OPF86721.1 glycine--tRNA ligase subunit beta [Vagococcus martis]